MNVTALNNYLKCPLEFYFKNLIRIPSPKNENTEFGSAVHDALEKLFRKMQDNDNQFPGTFLFSCFLRMVYDPSPGKFYKRTIRAANGIWTYRSAGIL